MSKLWLTSMSGPDNGDNVREMIDPIREYLDGVAWVFHDTSPVDEGVMHVNSLNFDTPRLGLAVRRRWPARHWVSMNDTLYSGLIEEGDWVIWSDCLERPRPEFVARIKTEIAPWMEANDVDVISYFGKPFLMRYKETLEYRGSPHWYLTGHNGRVVEWSTQEPDETKVRLNVRPLKRPDPFGWISHYVKYYTSYPAGSNHCLLGLEKNGDPNVLFPPREARRLAFRRYLRARQVPLTVEGVKQWMLAGPDEEGKGFVRAEKVLNDAWRYWTLGDRTLVDNHDHKDLVPIP